MPKQTITLSLKRVWVHCRSTSYNSVRRSYKSQRHSVHRKGGLPTRMTSQCRCIGSIQADWNYLSNRNRLTG